MFVETENAGFPFGFSIQAANRTHTPFDLGFWAARGPQKQGISPLFQSKCGGTLTKYGSTQLAEMVSRQFAMAEKAGH